MSRNKETSTLVPQQEVNAGEERVPSELELKIERDVRAILTKHGRMGIDLLRELGRQDLIYLIYKHYPGGFRSLRRNLEIKRVMPVRWHVDRIIAEAESFIREHGGITQRLLVGHGRHDLNSAIANHYPGQLTALKRDLEVKSTRKPSGYWTLERIEEEAQAFKERYGELTFELLEMYRMDLSGAIRMYPEGIKGLKIKLEIKGVKPRSYWTLERIEEEARRVLLTQGYLSENVLRNIGMSGFAATINSQYPGGILALKEKLGVKDSQKPSGYWTIQRIEAEASSVMKKHKRLSRSLLKTIGKSDLANAIGKRYTGGLTALKEKLSQLELDEKVSLSDLLGEDYEPE